MHVGNHWLRSSLLAAVLLMCPVGSVAAAEGGTGELPEVQGVPVLAQTVVPSSLQKPAAVLTVHGVRRIVGAAVVYYSMGVPASSAAPDSVNFSIYGTGFFNVLIQGPATTFFNCSVAALDVAGGAAYTALRVKDGPQCMSTAVGEFSTDEETGPNAAVVAYTLIAPLPADLSTVDLYIGSQALHGVPVEDGLLEPVR